MKPDDLVLLILNGCPPNSVGLKKLNKLAFLLEWSYIFDTGDELTDAKFVALPMGPVIDDYKNILKKMEQKKLILQNPNEQNYINYLPLIKAKIDSEKEFFLLSILKKYFNLSGSELELFTHSLASYTLTLEDNKNRYGCTIEKYLACLESSLAINSLEDQDETEQSVYQS